MDQTIILSAIGITFSLACLLVIIYFKIESQIYDWSKHITDIQAEQSKRTDQLYKLIIDMLKKGEK